eukprot:3535970-Amphidinium_carterae.1
MTQAAQGTMNHTELGGDRLTWIHSLLQTRSRINQSFSETIQTHHQNRKRHKALENEEKWRTRQLQPYGSSLLAGGLAN